LIPLIGFPSDKVFYARKERTQGESKYPLRKMISLAIEGVTSLSVTPLRMVTVVGLVISSLSFIMILIALIQHFLGDTVEGWTSMIFVILFIGGIQMLCIGILGEYIGKIYLETKARPKFFIEKKIK
jgi:glycosyltransferase involved in cell wall biosynthesis